MSRRSVPCEELVREETKKNKILDLLFYDLAPCPANASSCQEAWESESLRVLGSTACSSRPKESVNMSTVCAQSVRKALVTRAAAKIAS